MYKIRLINTTTIRGLVSAAGEAAEFFEYLYGEYYPLDGDGDCPEARTWARLVRTLDWAADGVESLLVAGKGTSGAKVRTPIAQLPFTSVDQTRDSDASGVKVYLWVSSENLCDVRGHQQGACDTSSGTYYGMGEHAEPMFCPRHYYQRHFEPNAAYHLVDETDDIPAEKPQF